MAGLTQLAGPLGVFFLAAIGPALTTAQECDANGGGSSYVADYTSLGCYNDSSVSILENLKVSTVAMTPQYCANFCGSRGYAYGGIEFTTYES
jgi:xylan 1,4-beta-xylosidase